MSPSAGPNQKTPIRIDLPGHTVQISANSSSAALTDTGLCYVWGMGFRSPTCLENHRFKSVEVGGQFTLLITEEGFLMMWGAENDEPHELCIV